MVVRSDFLEYNSALTDGRFENRSILIDLFLKHFDLSTKVEYLVLKRFQFVYLLPLNTDLSIHMCYLLLNTFILLFQFKYISGYWLHQLNGHFPN